MQRESLPAQPPETEAKAAPEPLMQDLTLPAGVSRVRMRLEIPDNARLAVEIETHTPDGRLISRQVVAAGTPHPAGAFIVSIWQKLRQEAIPASLSSWLVWLSLSLYLLVRLIELPAFPIFFFTDEAVQTVQAADFLTNHLRGAGGEFLPVYFINGSQYNLSASVYLQVLPYFLFGKSIWVTRGAAVLATLIAAAAVGLMHNRVFKSPYPWLAVLFLSITPAWFLHSRTAFETALACSFYAGFLYCYLMYRTENPRWLYGAVALAALAFYSYNPMRVIIGVNAALLLMVDFRYHLRSWRVLLRAAGLVLLLAVPFARFMVSHPDAAGWQMRLLGSYWLAEIPLGEKLANLLAQYLRGLDPLYWYLPNMVDLPRHLMLNYGHLLRQTLPLGIFGIFLALRHIRDPRFRTLLVAVLAAPSGAALVQIGITRLLVMVIPMAVLTALGAQWVMEWLHHRWKLSRPLLVFTVFTLLAGGNVYMLRDALVNGPTWFHDYGLTGMQWGAQQVFGEIASLLRAEPETRVVMSPSWSNGTDVVARYFFSDPLPFELASPAGFFAASRPLDDQTVVVMLLEEYKQIPRTRFSEVHVEKTLHYPDGRPGFYFVRMKYVENVREVITEEERQHRSPQLRQIFIDGNAVEAAFPRFDMGSIEQLFDHDPDTLVRTWAINPMELTFDFHAPRVVKNVILRIGGAATDIQVKAWPDGQGEPFEISRSLSQALNMRDVSLDFPQEVRAARLWVSIKNSADPPSGSVHLWEITVK